MDENMKNRIYEYLLEKHNIEEILTWNEFNLQEKLERQAFLEVQWREKYISANKKLEDFKRRKIEIEGEIFMEVRFPHLVDNNKNKYANVGAGIDKKEFEKYILPQDERIKKINKEIELQEIITDFYLTVYESLKRNAWNMKNWVDINRR
jgi:hypothetical protein